MRIDRYALGAGMAIALSVSGFGAVAGPFSTPKADLILHDGVIWTVDADMPQAQAVAITGNRIIGVGSDAEVLKHKGRKTEVIDLDGKMVLPGFIDAHTHFENAINAFFELRLNSVSDEETLMELIAERAQRIPDTYWITGGDWSAAVGWKAERAGEVVHSAFAPPMKKNGNPVTFSPSLARVDALTPNQPVLLKRYDGAYFINSYGMKLLHINERSPNPSGGFYEIDPETGKLSGMLYGTAGERAWKSLPPRARPQTMLGARAMVKELNAVGLTGIHDIARIPEISDQQVFLTHAERSMTDISILTDLRDADALTVRVYPILTAKVWKSLGDFGLTPGSGDDVIRYGAVKLFIDGFLMFREWRNAPGYFGSLSFRNKDEEELRQETLGASAAGWDVATHLTGDKAFAMALDWYEEAVQRTGLGDRRFRLLHAWYPRMQEIERAGALHMVGDITPYHLIREIPSIQKKLYPDQIDTAFAWQTMIQAGWRINIVSDWPGSYDGNHGAPVNPLENMYLAVTRSDFDGTPAGGFHPDQGLSIDQAIAAYTINPAWSSHEEKIKGSIAKGKLADIVVLSKNIREIPPAELLKTRVLMTIFDGRVVYEAPAEDTSGPAHH